MFLKKINQILVILCLGYDGVIGKKHTKSFVCNVNVDQETWQKELENTSDFEYAPRSFLLNKSRYWPSGIIPYEIDPLFSAPQVEFIKNSMKIFEDNSCLRWVCHDKEEDYVYFAKYSTVGVCNSLPGRRGSKQLLNLNDECFEVDDGYQGAVLHEMMHAIGFIHEQQRLDRDCYVDITEDAVKSNRVDFAIVLNTSIDFPYDFESIMHYGTSKYMHLDKSQNKNQQLGNGEGELTKLDILKINFMYCGGKSYCEQYPDRCAMFEEAKKRCAILSQRNKM